MLSKKAYREATGIKDASDAKISLANRVKAVVNAANKPFLLFILSVVQGIQDNAKIDDNRVTGLYELVANEAASTLPLWRVTFQVVGLLGELAQDSVQAMIDLWKASAFDESGDTDKAKDMLNRVYVARRGKGLAERLYKLKAIDQDSRNAAQDYGFISELVFSDIGAGKDVQGLTPIFESRILAKATGKPYDEVGANHVTAIRDQFKRVAAARQRLTQQGKTGKDSFVPFGIEANSKDVLAEIMSQPIEREKDVTNILTNAINEAKTEAPAPAPAETVEAPAPAPAEASKGNKRKAS